MEDIDPERALAALTQLEAERERRLQEKIEAGEVVRVPLVIECGVYEEADAVWEAEAAERAKARASVAHGDKTIIYDITYIYTGVPRPWDEPSDDRYAACVNAGEGVTSESPPLDCEPPPGATELPAGDQFENDEAASESIHEASPVYVFITIRHGDDGDPGEIREGMYHVSGGSVVLTDLDGRQITSRKLLDGKDPAKLARELLRETAPSDDFNRPIAYPRCGVA
jgi:hypothetical protein